MIILDFDDILNSTNHQLFLFDKCSVFYFQWSLK